MQVDAWLPRAARRHPERAAVGRTTYAALHADAQRVAGALAAQGVAEGVRVGLALPPGEELVTALHAVWGLGATAVPHDLRLTDAERPAADVVVAAVDRGEPRPLRAAHDLARVAVRLQTSGTSGAPKPVDLTFANVLWAALGSSVALGVRPDDRWLSALPLAHVGGLGIVMRSAVYGTAAVVHERWDTERVLHALRHDDITLISLVPTTLARLLDAGLRHPPALRCALLGAASVPPALQRRARQAGIPVAQTYGMTETCAMSTVQSPGDEGDDAGFPLFCTRVHVAPDGELVVSGPTVAGGGGPHPTGDLGSIDRDGRVTITGRKADTIVTGGENVAPPEVEAALAEHPAVLEAGVRGREHPVWGEAVVATVVLRPGAHATEAELRAHCAARLAGFKVPKDIRFASALPRGRSGKLLRRSL